MSAEADKSEALGALFKDASALERYAIPMLNETGDPQTPYVIGTVVAIRSSKSLFLTTAFHVWDEIVAPYESVLIGATEVYKKLLRPFTLDEETDIATFTLNPHAKINF